jgi:hypothetical protein
MNIKHSTYREGYDAAHPWPEDCFCQCGGNLSATGERLFNYPGSEKHPNKAFFEAFPKSPISTFLRGDSSVSLAEAEQKAWNRYQKICACTVDHTKPENFDPKGYENGLGFCKSCGVGVSEIFPPAHKCPNCDKPNYYSPDKTGAYWCEDCAHLVPEDRLSETQIWCREMKESVDETSPEEIEKSLPEVIEHILGALKNERS